MKFIVAIFFLYCFLVSSIHSMAQNNIDTFFVTAKQNHVGKTNYKLSIDSSTLQNATNINLGQALQQNTSLYIKTNGANSLSTPSIRGSNASQVPILWNGMNINGLSLSLTDFNLMPSFFVDNINVLFGGNSSTWGSGDIGGSIHLNNNLKFTGIKKTIQLGLLHNSAAQNQITLLLKAENKKWVTQARLLLNRNPNNFTYLSANPITGIENKIKLPHALMLQYGLLQEVAYTPNINNRLDAKLWTLYTYRQLPPNIYQATSRQYQADKFWRILLDWKHNVSYGTYNFRVNSNKEYLLYNDTSISLSNDYTTHILFAEAEGLFKINNHVKVNTSLAMQNGTMQTEKYNGTKQQQRWIGRLGILVNTQNWEIITSTRQEIVNGKYIPFVGNIQVGHQINNTNKIAIALLKNYRLPTFNDLYWAGSGNTDLKSESGLEQNITYTFKNNKLFFSTALYNKNVSNWILWTPFTGNLWKPFNIAKVHSYGIDAQIQYKLLFKNTYWQFTTNYSYNTSVNKEHQYTNLIGKQLIYTPQHKITNNLSCTYETANIFVNNFIVSKSFTTTDNTTIVNGYNVVDAGISNVFKFNHTSFIGNVAINNVLNKNYVVLDGRPMPLRNYSFGIKVNIQ